MADKSKHAGHFLLNRNEQSDHGTFGRMDVGGKVFYIAEPPSRNNLVGKSCVPAKTYLYRWQKSPKYGWCYEITDVPGRTRCLVHAGNLAGNADLGLKTHTLGCQLPGFKLGWIKVRGISQRAVLNSRNAVRVLAELLEHRDFLVTIQERKNA